jgi:hypothetical protein
MKVIEFVDVILDFFTNDIIGDQKAVYHPNVIIGHLRNVFDQVIYNTYLNGKKFSDYSQLDSWGRVYTATVQNQVGTKAYIFLPFTPVQLPDGMGVRQVADHADNSNVFAPIDQTANVVFAELEVDAMDTTPTYRLEQNNMATSDGEKSHILRLERLPVAPDAIAEVDVTMIVPLSEMGDYDEVIIPTGMADTIIRQVIDIMRAKPAADTLNDMEPKVP